MTSKLATYLTVVILGVGTSGAIALASKDSPAGPKGGAATGQYQPGKGCGDTNHQRVVLPGQKPCPGVSGSAKH